MTCSASCTCRPAASTGPSSGVQRACGPQVHQRTQGSQDDHGRCVLNLQRLGAFCRRRTRCILKVSPTSPGHSVPPSRSGTACGWAVLTMLLPAGYNHPVDDVLDELVGCLDHPALPLLQWKEELSSVESRLPSGVLGIASVVMTRALADNTAVTAWQHALLCCFLACCQPSVECHVTARGLGQVQ